MAARENDRTHATTRSNAQAKRESPREAVEALKRLARGVFPRVAPGEFLRKNKKRLLILLQLGPIRSN